MESAQDPHIHAILWLSSCQDPLDLLKIALHPIIWSHSKDYILNGCRLLGYIYIYLSHLPLLFFEGSNFEQPQIRTVRDGHIGHGCPTSHEGSLSSFPHRSFPPGLTAVASPSSVVRKLGTERSESERGASESESRSRRWTPVLFFGKKPRKHRWCLNVVLCV